MSEWKEYKLGEICQILDFKRIPLSSTQRTERKGKYPYYGASGVIDYVDDYIFDGEYVLISEDGENLRTRQTPIAFIANGKFWVNNHAHIVQADDIHSRLLCYFFAKVDLNPYITGAVQPKLNQSALSSIPIYLPESLEERKRIAGILSSLDDKIDLLGKQNATLEAMAGALFRQYFIENSNPDWKDGYLGDLILETVGGEWGKEAIETDFTKAVQCIRGTDIADLNIGLASKVPIRFIKVDKFSKIEPRQGDLILEISGGTETQSTGRVTYVNDNVKALFSYPLIFSNFCRLLRIKNKDYSYYLYCYIQYLYNQDEFFNLENGSSGIKNLDYKSLLFNLKYTMPANENEIISFGKTVEPYFEKINKNKLQICSLTKLRDTLLPKLMNNDIRVDG